VLPLLLHGIPLILAPSPLPEAVRRAAEGESALTLPPSPQCGARGHEADRHPAERAPRDFRRAPLSVNWKWRLFQSRGLKLHNYLRLDRVRRHRLRRERDSPKRSGVRRFAQCETFLLI